MPPGPPVHRFSAVQRQLRDDWFANGITTDSWVDEGPIGEGIPQAIRVRNTASGMMGAAKPGPAYQWMATHCVAAHERIAFGLAHLSDLPVGAVVLWGDDIPNPYVLGRAISSWAFPSAMKWSEADRAGLISPAAKASAGALYSMMRVFHTWIGDTDRKGDHIIIDLNSPSDDLAIAFIDHGHSLSMNWTAWDAPVAPCPHYLADLPIDTQAMIDAADHIAAIPDVTVSQLIGAIPASYLPARYRDNILQNLLARKGNLRAAMGV